MIFIQRRVRLPRAVRQARRGVRLLAIAGLLGLSSLAAVAGGELPAHADAFNVSLRAHNASPDYNVATVPIGQQVILTATTSIDVQPTPYYIDIYDVTTGTMLNQCPSGVECDWPVSESAASTQTYVAYVAAWDQNGGVPPQIQSISPETEYITWTNDGIQIGLGGPSSLPAGKGGTYLAAAIGNVPKSGYTIQIVDETTGQALKDCSSTPECSVNYIPKLGLEFLVAFIIPAGISTNPFTPFSPLASSLLWLTGG
jgi:hypothetical protein